MKDDSFIIRINSDLKKQSKEVLSKLNLSYTDFIYLAYQKLVEMGRLPFDIPQNDNQISKTLDTSISIRFDSELKQQGNKILENLELTPAIFLRMAYRKLVEKQTLPF